MRHSLQNFKQWIPKECDTQQLRAAVCKLCSAQLSTRSFDSAQHTHTHTYTRVALRICCHLEGVDELHFLGEQKLVVESWMNEPERVWDRLIVHIYRKEQECYA